MNDLTVYTPPATVTPAHRRSSFWGTYLHLNLPVWSSNRQVIAAGRRKLAPGARCLRKHRAVRHQFLRDLLACHTHAQTLYSRVQAGDFSERED